MRELLEAGVHFGHQTRRWNPKMKRFIFTERGGIYIIDLQQTSELLQEAYDFARNIASRGGSILFVGTKKQAQDSIEQEAARVGMPYVSNRWLGGLLTNWKTITDRIAHLHELRRLKTEGQLELLPAKERITMLAELEKLESNLGGVADLTPPARRRLHRRPEEGAAGSARGAAARPADHRARRHELRSGRGRLHHSGQRRRDPLLQPDRARDRRGDRRRQDPRHRGRADRPSGGIAERQRRRTGEETEPAEAAAPAADETPAEHEPLSQGETVVEPETPSEITGQAAPDEPAVSATEGASTEEPAATTEGEETQ